MTCANLLSNTRCPPFEHDLAQLDPIAPQFVDQYRYAAHDGGDPAKRSCQQTIINQNMLLTFIPKCDIEIAE